MLLRQSPFHGENEDRIYKDILEGGLLYPTDMSGDSCSLIKQLLVRDPQQRLRFGPEDVLEIMRHAFFEGIDWDDLYSKRIPAPLIPPLEIEHGY